MEPSFKIPFYAKTALILIGILAFVFTMKVGQHIIIPILYASIFAILLNPLVNFLVRKNVNKIISISIAVIFAIFVVMGILYVVSSQVTMFSKTYPQLVQKFNITSTEFVQWISQKTNTPESKINEWIKDSESKALSNFAIGETLSEVIRIMIIGMLLPVYLFMILYYKPLLLEFVRKLFRSEYHVAVAEILINTKNIIQSYLVGLFFRNDNYCCFKFNRPSHTWY